jgi:hypothetical protein
MAADIKTRTVARLVLAELGVGAADLQTPLTVPTIAGVVPRVLAAATPSMRRTYGSYWTRAVERFGDRRLDEIHTSDLSAFKQQVISTARRRRNSRGSRYAGEYAVRAMRARYRMAVADGWIHKGDDHAARVALPRRLRSTRRGLSRQEIGDLQWTPVTPPTFADYLPTVVAAAGPGARRTYGTYWDRILSRFADRRLDQVTVTDVEILMHDTMAATVLRRTARNGVCAAEHLLAALRAIYTRAVADRLIPPHHNPAAQVRKPRRPPNNRRALTSD